MEWAGGSWPLTVAHEQTPMLLPLRTLNQASTHPGCLHHLADGEAKAQRGRLTPLQAHSSQMQGWDLYQASQLLHLAPAPPGILEGSIEGTELSGTDTRGHLLQSLRACHSDSSKPAGVCAAAAPSALAPPPRLCSESGPTPLLPPHRPPGCLWARARQTAACRPHPTHSLCPCCP